MSRIAYRPDIDGLRAVAVLLVVGYHFGVPGLSGGYIGVDLFFVISGFLIASLLDREPVLSLATMAGFYGRRIKRLMPAFVVVAAVTGLVAAAIMLPDDLEAFIRSVRESLAFRANLYFEHETTGYFAADSAELPWLHTWSLSVEWQFYFVFPLLAVILRRLRAPWMRSAATAALVVGGLLLSTSMVAVDATHAYFSAPARAFEFVAGASVATWSGRPPSTRVAWLLSAACVAALVALALVFTPTTAFPGLPAAAVCAIACVAIGVGRAGSPLSAGWLAWVGRRSYSIYLWHWPVVALLAYVQLRPHGWETIPWLALVLALSQASHRWVERSGVALRWRLPRSAATLCVLPLACVAASWGAARHAGGWPARLGPEAAHATDTVKRHEVAVARRCHDFDGPDLEACAFGDLQASTSALLIGDSHARHFRPFVQVLADDAHVKVYGLTDSECLTLPGTGRPANSASTRGVRTSCVDAIARDYRLVASGRFRYVLLAQRWIGYPPEAIARLDDGLAAIVAAGSIPVVFTPAAEDGTNPKDCFYRPIKIHRPRVGDCAIATDNDYARPAKHDVATLMAAMRDKYPTLRIVDPQSVQCHDGRCTTVIDATPIYTDTHHLAAFGATMLGLAYRDRVGNPLRDDPSLPGARAR